VIGKIAGRLELRGEGQVMIDVGGVGYVVHCSERTLAALPGPGAPVALFTELVVREDLMQLYGFPTLAEREWHRLLTSVQGVGARGALAILGALGVEGLARAIALGDVGSIRRAPGIGPKIAQRVVLELKSRAPAVMAMGGQGARRAMVPGMPLSPPEPAPAPVTLSEHHPDGVMGAEAQADALSALVNLGYAQGEAAAAVAEISTEAALATPELIRAALRRLAPKG
jgi:holliday junction DNA helicase RuvA